MDLGETNSLFPLRPVIKCLIVRAYSQANGTWYMQEQEPSKKIIINRTDPYTVSALSAIPYRHPSSISNIIVSQ